jgi:DNA polymerase-1
MVKVDEFLNKRDFSKKAKLILQVHDELVYEVEDSLVEGVWKNIKEIMESCLPASMSEGVPIVVDASVGKSWGEMKAISK